MASPIVILAAALGAVGLATVLAVALGRVSAHADRSSERLLAQRAHEASGTIRAARLPSAVSYAGVAGLAAAHETISREPSITLPSSSTSVGTMRLPVSRCTS